MAASPERSPPAAGLLAGTTILTQRGHVPVEALHVGDRVTTRLGALRPLRWIGRQTLFTLGAGERLAPIALRAGALAANQPARDLWLAPGHAILVQDHLVRAHLLLNGTTIVQPPHTGEIRYLHLDLAEHDCILAEGAWAETCSPGPGRDAFDNAADHRARFPGETQGTPPPPACRW
jgi:hypothetical protein